MISMLLVISNPVKEEGFLNGDYCSQTIDHASLSQKMKCASCTPDTVA